MRDKRPIATQKGIYGKKGVENAHFTLSKQEREFLNAKAILLSTEILIALVRLNRERTHLSSLRFVRDTPTIRGMHCLRRRMN